MDAITYRSFGMSAATDDPLLKRAVDALLNGLGAKIAQVLIILAPIVSGLAYYAWDRTMEVQYLKLNAISEKLDYSIRQGRESEKRINSLENSVGRIEERQAAQDARLSALEKRR